MSQTTAVQFSTPTRIHIGLPVRDLGRAVRFYTILFGQEPTKTRPGYAKFEVADPPINLSVNETQHRTGPNDPISHFGVQVKSTAAVESITRRFAELGIETRVEENVTCCNFELDRRGNIVDYQRRPGGTGCGSGPDACRDC